jgi:hypothetical protein
MKSRLYDSIDLVVDQVIFEPFCARRSEQIEALGRLVAPPDAGMW